MIITYYGNGKGKTTAALGLALRASGYNKKILFAQFVKSPKSITGEDKALKKIHNLTHKKFGLGFVGLLKDSRSLEEHALAAQKGLNYISKHMKEFDIIVCDEILGAIKGRLLKESDVKKLIQSVLPSQSLIFTGRPKYKSILELSDLATEMEEIKHPYQKGTLAAEGIDY